MAGARCGAALTTLAEVHGSDALAFALGFAAALALIGWLRVRAIAVSSARREDELQRVTDQQAAALQQARVELERELQRSRRLASLGQLVGGVAHDFNNLLTVVLGNAQLVEHQVTGLPQAAAQRIRAAAEQGQRMTRQLFAVAGEQVVSLDPCELGEVLAELLPTLQQLVGPRVKVGFAPAALPAMVRALPSQIEQILMNLFSNARDALTEGGRVEVGIEVTEARVLLTVRDDGPGMTAEVKARAFEPYFTTKSDGRDHGIGLATVKWIVLQLGGHVRIDSEPGKGALFTIDLPRADHEPPVVLPSLPPARGAVGGDAAAAAAAEADTRPPR